MPGICPICIRLEPEAERCPVCGGELLSPQEWEARKAEALANNPAGAVRESLPLGPEEIGSRYPERSRRDRQEGDASPRASTPLSTSGFGAGSAPTAVEPREHNGIQMAMGCLTGIVVFMVVFWLAYLTFHHAG